MKIFAIFDSNSYLRTQKVEPDLSSKKKEKGFYIDWDRLNKVLIFDDQTIYSKYKTEFDELDRLELAQADEEREEKHQALQNKVKNEFNAYLKKRLGPTRTHLIPKIIDLFSQKPLTSFFTLFDQESMKKHQWTFQNGKMENTCSLLIPPAPTDPVQIQAKIRVVYKNFFDPAKMEMKELSSPILLDAEVTHTLGPMKQHTGKVAFTMSPSKPQEAE